MRSSAALSTTLQTLHSSAHRPAILTTATSGQSRASFWGRNGRSNSLFASASEPSENGNGIRSFPFHYSHAFSVEVSEKSFVLCPLPDGTGSVDHCSASFTIGESPHADR